MINNRLISYLIMAVLAAMGLLIVINMSTYLFSNAADTYFDHYEVRGMAIQHDQKLYTLNFAQQNSVIEILNKSVAITKPAPDNTLTSPGFDRIIVYRFNKPDLTINPVGFSNEQLIFALPELKPNTFLMETSGGFLQELLSQTYD